MNYEKITIEVMEVWLSWFLADFGHKTRLKSAQCPKSAKSAKLHTPEQIAKTLIYK